MSRRQRQAGISLVELMVAMLIGLVLTAGVLQVFAGNSQAYRFHEALSRIQENGRFAIDELTRDIRMAGYLGCSSQVTTFNNIYSAAPAEFAPALGLQGWEAAGTAPGDELDLDYSAAAVATSGGGWSTQGGVGLPVIDAVPGSDIVRIWRGDENGPRIVNIATAPTVVTITANNDFQSGDLLMFSDCRSADWVRACTVADTATSPVQTNLTLDASCNNTVPHNITTAAGGEANRILGNIYYVSKRDNNAPPSLYRSRLDGGGGAATGEEVVEGVESFQILYGVDTSGNRRADSYEVADDVDDWRSVVSVRISLLLVSVENNLVEAPQPVFFNGADQTPDDRRLRQVMTTTIALRNRMP